MDIYQLTQRAMEVREKYRTLELKTYGKEWTTSQIMEGFVGDVGMLMKLIMVKDGIRLTDNVDEKIAHEISDCLWSILVIAKQLNIDLEKSFLQTMETIEQKITK